MYTLYVIPGSHACRAAMLMLEHKQVPYRRVDIPHAPAPACGPGAYGLTPAARDAPPAHGARFRCAWAIDSARVPALAANGERDLDQSRIARFLDRSHPEPRLFPADPKQRRRSKTPKRWANEKLQMAPAGSCRGRWLGDPAAFSRKGD